MKLVLLTIILLISYPVLAEDVLRPKGKPKVSSTSNNNINYSIPFSIGVELGVNYNMFSVDQTWDTQLDNSIFEVYNSMDGFSAFFGVFGDYSISDKTGIQAKLQYGSVYVQNSGNGNIDCTIYDEFSGLPLDNILTNTNADINISYDQLNLELYFRYNFTNEFFGMIGPVFLLPISNPTFELTQSLSDDNECYFLADPNDAFSEQLKSRTITTDADDALFRIGLGAIIGYKYQINDQLWIAPNLQYQLVPTVLFEDDSYIDNSQMNYRFTNGLNPTTATVTAENYLVNHFRFSVQLGMDILN